MINDMHHYEFFNTETGKCIAEKVFFTRHIQMADGTDMSSPSLIEQVAIWKRQLSINLEIPENHIKPVLINDLDADD